MSKSANFFTVLENAGTIEVIEDDVVVAVHDSDEELPSSIDPLVDKGIKWTIVDNMADTRYIPKQRGHMLCNRTQQLDSESSRRELDYFMPSFPDKAVAEILDCTSGSMLKSKPSAIPVSKGELFIC
jgi:hypothetical protein